MTSAVGPKTYAEAAAEAPKIQDKVVPLKLNAEQVQEKIAFLPETSNAKKIHRPSIAELTKAAHRNENYLKGEYVALKTEIEELKATATKTNENLTTIEMSELANNLQSVEANYEALSTKYKNHHKAFTVHEENVVAASAYPIIPENLYPVISAVHRTSIETITKNQTDFTEQLNKAKESVVSVNGSLKLLTTELNEIKKLVDKFHVVEKLMQATMKNDNYIKEKCVAFKGEIAELKTAATKVNAELKEMSRDVLANTLSNLDDTYNVLSETYKTQHNEFLKKEFLECENEIIKSSLLLNQEEFKAKLKCATDSMASVTTTFQEATDELDQIKVLLDHFDHTKYIKTYPDSYHIGALFCYKGEKTRISPKNPEFFKEKVPEMKPEIKIASEATLQVLVEQEPEQKTG